MQRFWYGYALMKRWVWRMGNEFNNVEARQKLSGMTAELVNAALKDNKKFKERWNYILGILRYQE